MPRASSIHPDPQLGMERLPFIGWYASQHHRLISPQVNAGTIRLINVRLFAAPIMFLVAAPFAYLSSIAVIVVWWLSPLAVLLATRLSGKPSPVARNPA